MRKLLPLLFCLMLTACAAGTVKPQSGGYRMSAPPETVATPVLNLDAETGAFVFSYDPLSSFLPVGRYEQDGSVLLCHTDDGQRTYLFRIVNQTTLAFIAEGSADVSPTDARLSAPVADGSVFLLTP